MDTRIIIWTALLGIIVIAVFSPVIVGMIETADDVYECQNTAYPVISRDNLLCTNVSYVCLTKLNISVPPNLCTNASGVSIANATATSGFSVYNESSTDVGISSTENALLRLTLLFIVLGLAFAVFNPVISKSK